MIGWKSLQTLLARTAQTVLSDGDRLCDGYDRWLHRFTDSLRFYSYVRAKLWIVCSVRLTKRLLMDHSISSVNFYIFLFKILCLRNIFNSLIEVEKIVFKPSSGFGF
jgi:hypothetical protein